MTATAPEHVPVAVIGAGPTGLTAATLLARHGVPALVLERHRAPYPLPRAVHLDDEVHRILQAVGIHETFSEISRPARGMQLLDGSHRVLAEFLRDNPCGRHGFPEANMFDQPELEQLLRDNLAKHPLVTLRGGVEVTAVTPPRHSGAPVEVSFRDKDTSVSHTLLADAVLGCDGANSLVRAAIGSQMQDLATAQEWLVVDVRCRLPLPAWEGVHQICDPQRAATYMRIGEDRYRWEFRLRTGEQPEELTDRKRLLELIAPWTPGIPEDELHVLRTASYTFRAQVADRWRKGRIFLLGDAAHLTPPFIGQGLCAGMRDAHNLAWKLARVFTGRASEALLNSYQAERRRHARQLIRTAVALGAVMTGGGTGTALARNAVLPAISRLPGASSLVLSAVSPPLRPGPLVGSRRRGHPRPGTQCPQPLVPDTDGTSRLLDDLLGEGFALLATATLSPALHALVRTLDARVIQLRDVPRQQPGTGGADLGADPGTSALVHWMGTAGAVLLRPDRVVLATAARPRPGRTCGDDLAAAVTAWAPMLCSSGRAAGAPQPRPRSRRDGG
ncbi:bifunctional 3-(3-hydroxy-phenyl)propionate/3-hydroxycinnamic acid hydroxylase MhpA [Streptomyces sp. NBC_01800]|uniref:bifunctional 3-(3-hydroxy-phenyl)propionate/3-hydroxycinnamic acid hydroxylase MhpA n=1 Tax=Streptomyces sp. NBC_01800 TaxID=2975945 RepID=UPI002DD8A412|nr:bifunctional 3-(3-hydroxy-phenyl)propionate/3-hydroxycinnamic acid hydroxylase [Streptomyces sp. NBC_01800]WSA73169.1 bifunctional 3-(3-hydroxy-phenyl)propionate/3-hydroxycinnamic acid hydroxylase [Streptomyces sp. NBC_01800]